MKALERLVTTNGGPKAFAKSIGYTHPYIWHVLNGGTPSFAFCQAVRKEYGVILDPAEWPDARRKVGDKDGPAAALGVDVDTEPAPEAP